jgi:mono/diheme cytochrome c family protein
MTRAIVLVIIVASFAIPAGPTLAASRIPLKSAKVEMPEDEPVFADGPGVDAVNGNCLACHSASMVLNQPPLAKPQWEAEVTKMRNVYKAPIDAKDVDAIVGYLAGLKAGE